MLLFVNALLVFAGLELALAGKPLPVLTANDVCQGRIPKIVAMSQITKLGAITKETAKECPTEAVATIGWLQKLINLNKMGMICSPSGSYYFNEIISKYMIRGRAQPLPLVMRQFIETMAFSISAHCKLNVLKNIDTLTKELKPIDFKMINDLQVKGAGMFDHSDRLMETDLFELTANVLRTIRDAKRITKPQDFEGGIVPTEVANRLSPETIDMLTKFKSKCDSMYGLIYRRILQPVIRMSDHGYDYSVQSPLLNDFLREINDNKVLKTLTNAAIICESLGPYKENEPQVGDVGKLLILNQNKLDAIPMSNILKIDPSRDLMPAKMASSGSERNADMWRNTKLYEKVIGVEANIIDRTIKTSQRFWYGYLMFIDSKLTGKVY